MMMETEPFEALKKEWKGYTETQAKELNFGQQDLQQLFQSKVKHSLKNIYRNMWIDVAVMILLTSGFITTVFWFQFELRFFVSTILVVTAGVLSCHFYIKHRVFSPLDLSKDSLVPAVQKMIQQLGQYIRLYTWGATVLSISFLIAVKAYLFYYIHGNFQFNEVFFHGLTYAIPLGIITYLLARWLAQQMYGHHLRHLQESYEGFLRAEADERVKENNQGQAD